MINKLIGIFGLLSLVISAVGYALWVKGITNVGIGNFISIPSFVIVVAFSGLTYAKKERYIFHELGKVLKHDMILGGWIGTIIGLILTFALVDNDIVNHVGELFNRVGAAMITLFYGYMIGNIVESCWSNKVWTTDNEKNI